LRFKFFLALRNKKHKEEASCSSFENKIRAKARQNLLSEWMPLPVDVILTLQFMIVCDDSFTRLTTIFSFVYIIFR